VLNLPNCKLGSSRFTRVGHPRMTHHHWMALVFKMGLSDCFILGLGFAIVADFRVLMSKSFCSCYLHHLSPHFLWALTTIIRMIQSIMKGTLEHVSCTSAIRKLRVLNVFVNVRSYNLVHSCSSLGIGSQKLELGTSLEVEADCWWLKIEILLPKFDSIELSSL
jgi:hypothetical protein